MLSLSNNGNEDEDDNSNDELFEKELKLFELRLTQ